MGAIPQVPDRPSSPPGNTLLTCDHCNFSDYEEKEHFIEIHNILLCPRCYRIFQFTCTSCEDLFLLDTDMCRIDEITCKPCCNDACGGDCNHIPKEVKNDS